MAQSDGGSFSNAPLFLRQAVDTVGAINTLIKEIGDFFELLDTDRAAAIDIYNFTKSKITIKDTGHEFGDFKDKLPHPEIKPENSTNDPGVDAFVSSFKGILPNGTQGHVNYDIDGNNFFIGWDVPFHASNKCDCNVTGPRANRFRVFKEIPESGSKVHAQFVIWQNDGPFSLRALLPQQFNPSMGIRKLQPDNKPISIRQLVGI
jgi:hypothetical protein